MSSIDLIRLQIAFGLVGAALGFAVGMYLRNRVQLEAAPGLLTVAGAVLFFFAAPFLLLFALAFAVLAFGYLAVRYHALWFPSVAAPLRRLAEWTNPPPTLADLLADENDDFDASVEAILALPEPPNVKTRLLEQLEADHRRRLQQLLNPQNSPPDP